MKQSCPNAHVMRYTNNQTQYIDRR